MSDKGGMPKVRLVDIGHQARLRWGRLRTRGTNVRCRLARWMRDTADRISPNTGPRAIGIYFTIETGTGLVVHPTTGTLGRTRGPGVQLWFMAEDYHRAFRDPAG
jgi:hypothetical protein